MGEPQPIKIVVFDNMRQSFVGVRPWAEWPARTRAQLLAEDPEAMAHAPDLQQIFEGYMIDVREVRTGDELADQIDDAEFLVVHKERVPADLLARGRRLRLIQHLGLDHRGIPLETARAMGVPVAAPPLINYLAVAEHTWALILNHLKQLPAQRVHMQQRNYPDSWGTFPNLRLARDLVLGLAGLGEIGRAVARIAHAFDMPIIYWDQQRFPDLEARFATRYVAWEELFATADVLSIHLALTDQTRGIIGAREIGLMKSTSFFVNTARGKLVDQPALVAALHDRAIGGAGLDVYGEEPLPPADALHDLHEQLDYNVTLTPHSAWQSPWTWIRDSQSIWFNIRRALRGEPLEHLVST